MEGQSDETEEMREVKNKKKAHELFIMKWKGWSNFSSHDCSHNGGSFVSMYVDVSTSYSLYYAFIKFSHTELQTILDLNSKYLATYVNMDVLVSRIFLHIWTIFNSENYCLHEKILQICITDFLAYLVENNFVNIICNLDRWLWQ